jgi:hypothetical protein
MKIIKVGDLDIKVKDIEMAVWYNNKNNRQTRCGGYFIWEIYLKSNDFKIRYRIPYNKNCTYCSIKTTGYGNY